MPLLALYKYNIYFSFFAKLFCYLYSLSPPSSKKLPSRHWEFYAAALIELLVRKRVLTEEEVLDSLLK